MAAPSDDQGRGVILPHSCHHCNTFIIHLFDERNELRTDIPIWHTPNSSLDGLAARLYGDDFWADEWAPYREDFYCATNGISIFAADRDELEGYSRDGCLLSRRFLECLREDELSERYAIGARIITSYS